MEVKERFIVLHCDSNIRRQSCSPIHLFSRGKSLIEYDDDSAGAKDFLHNYDNACAGAKICVPV